MDARTPLRYVKGVGPRRGEAFAKVGIETVEDLLFVLPFRYEDRRSFARVGELARDSAAVTLDVSIRSSRLIRTRRRGFTMFEATLADETGEIKALWYNQPYLERVLVAGRRAVVFGRPGLDRFARKLILESPEYEILDPADSEGIHGGRIVPVYRKTAGLGTRPLRSLLFRILAEADPKSFAESIPAEIVAKHQLLPRHEALRGVHFPAGDADPAALGERRSLAHRTLAYEEIFLLQLALALKRHSLREERRAIPYTITAPMRSRLAKLVPFTLTEGQRRVLKEIRADLESPHPMNRLLQGDVGSGKTIVAILTMLLAVENDAQAVIMAPTEILAEQHFRNLDRLLGEGSEFKRAVLTGSVRAKQRRTVLAGIASGETQIVVGTHALFEKRVEFHRLGLVVVDEQHRFGVLQRAALTAKGSRPDVLVMTATPIPRSLALTAYGDLDLSVLDELPPGRVPVRTVVRFEGDRARVYLGVREAVSRGRQAFVVVPLVEETEAADLKAAVAFARELSRGALAGINVGLVHGRMKAAEKDAVMRAFAAGEIAVLVATTVVEVGVDVPNASVMVVEHAERFGLSQLHQLRGRVGRGASRSYCVLMLGDPAAGAAARARLEIMAETDDGFAIAETDLKMRGPGAVFGTWQHGLSDLQFLAAVIRDPAWVESARAAAAAWVQRPGGAAAGRALLGSMRGVWRRRLELAGVG